MSEINKNIDSIGKNLEFKSFIFITLFGAWLWLLNHFISGISSPPKEMINPIVSFVFICGFFVSYIIFYYLVNLGIMLMYSSIYKI